MYARFYLLSTLHAMKLPHFFTYMQGIILRSHSKIAATGRQQGGQTINIVKTCETFKETVQDLLHSLGMYNEIQRPDRNKFVRIMWNNIIRGKTTDHYRIHRN